MSCRFYRSKSETQELYNIVVWVLQKFLQETVSSKGRIGEIKTHVALDKKVKHMRYEKMFRKPKGHSTHA